MKASQQEIGQRGEVLARDYLIRACYTIIATNWRCAEGEIDIVAKQQNTLVFVEVRSRRAANTESAFASLAPAKQERMIKAAYAYLAAHEFPADTSWRIDAIAVALRRSAPPIIEHVENVLDW